MGIDPGDLHKRQQQGESREPVPSQDDGQENGQVQERERLGADVHPPCEDQESGEPGQNHDPHRPVAAARGHQHEQRHARDDTLRQIERHDPPVLINPTDRDLEEPVQVDPRDVDSREGEGISARNLPALADQIASSEVPVKVGVFEREGAQEKRQCQEQNDQKTIRQRSSQRRLHPRIGPGGGPQL